MEPIITTNPSKPLLDYIPPKPLKTPQPCSVQGRKNPPARKIGRAERGGGGFWPGLNPSMNTQASVEISSLDYTIRLVELS